MNVAILPAIAIHAGVERWAIKTSVPAGAYTKNATWVGLAGGLREGSMVWTTGYLTLAALEPDGDFHLQLVLESGATEVIIVETTNPLLRLSRRRSAARQGRPEGDDAVGDPSGSLRGAAVSEEEVT